MVPAESGCQGQQCRSNCQTPGTCARVPPAIPNRARDIYAPSPFPLVPLQDVDDATPLGCPSFWRALVTLHLVEFLLFIARWIPPLTYYVGRYALWMDSARKVTVDDSTSILNLNCRVRVLPLHIPQHAHPPDPPVSTVHGRMGDPLRTREGLPSNPERLARTRI